MEPMAFWAGVLVCGGGALVAAWALIGDRARGRRRCPRCWYEMAGVPGLLCPECGHTAAAESRLFRSRRRWRALLVAAVILAGGYGLIRAEDVAEDGWAAAVPRAMLTPLLPLFNETGEALLANEASLAAQAGLFPTNRWVAADDDVSMLAGAGAAGPGPPGLAAPARLGRWERLLLAAQLRRVIRAHCRGEGMPLAELGVDIRTVAEVSPRLYAGEMDLLVPDLVVLLKSGREHDRVVGLMLLRACNGAGPGALQPLARVIQADPEPRVRGMAAVTMVALYPDSPRAAAAVGTLLEDEDPWARYAAADVLRRFSRRAAEPMLPLLRQRAEHETDTWAKTAALSAIRAIEQKR